MIPSTASGAYSAAVRWAPSLLLGLALGACAGVEEGALDRLAVLEGALTLPEGAAGDAWVFLYAPGEGFPGAPATPKAVTAVSALRLGAGDPRYVLAAVPPNPYRLWGFLDADRSFDPAVDVLAQPGAGDRVAEGQEINVQPGLRQGFPLAVRGAVADEPPAFEVDGTPAEVTLDDLPGVPTAVTVTASDVGGRLDRRHVGFRVGLVDEDGDGLPDDADGDRIPDLWPRVFLRWLPRPGQQRPGTTTVRPAVFDPTPFLAELGRDVTRTVLADRLQLFVLSQAQELTQGAGRTEVRFLAEAPAGDYQLVALARTGQYWLMPNDLASTDGRQAVRFHSDRKAGP